MQIDSVLVELGSTLENFNSVKEIILSRLEKDNIIIKKFLDTKF